MHSGKHCPQYRRRRQQERLLGGHHLMHTREQPAAVRHSRDCSRTAGHQARAPHHFVQLPRLVRRQRRRSTLRRRQRCDRGEVSAPPVAPQAVRQARVAHRECTAQHMQQQAVGVAAGRVQRAVRRGAEQNLGTARALEQCRRDEQRGNPLASLSLGQGALR